MAWEHQSHHPQLYSIATGDNVLTQGYDCDYEEKFQGSASGKQITLFSSLNCLLPIQMIRNSTTKTQPMYFHILMKL